MDHGEARVIVAQVFPELVQNLAAWPLYRKIRHYHLAYVPDSRKISPADLTPAYPSLLDTPAPGEVEFTPQDISTRSIGVVKRNKKRPRSDIGAGASEDFVLQSEEAEPAGLVEPAAKKRPEKRLCLRDQVPPVVTSPEKVRPELPQINSPEHLFGPADLAVREWIAEVCIRTTQSRTRDGDMGEAMRLCLKYQTTRGFAEIKPKYLLEAGASIFVMAYLVSMGEPVPSNFSAWFTKERHGLPHLRDNGPLHALRKAFNQLVTEEVAANAPDANFAASSADTEKLPC